MKRLLVAAMASLAMLSFAKADETVHKWWESPKVVGLTDMNISSIDGGGCHVGVDPAQTYVGMTVGTKGGASAPLYTWASLESGSATPVNDPRYTSFTNATMHGSAISTVLGVNLVGGLYYDRAEKPRRLGTMYSFPLTSDELVEDGNVFVIENDKGWSIDNYFFSPDNQYLYSTTVDKGVGSEEGFSAAKLYKWQIKNDLKASGTNLVLVGEVHDFTNAICCAAFAVVNGHEIYYASDARSVRAYDITAGTQTTIIDAEEYAALVTNVEIDDQNGSAGSLWISGIAEGTPRLTILTSDTSSSAYIDKLAVYQLDGNGTSKISRLALFNYDQMKAFGIGIATGGGASATVKDDDSSLLFSFSYSAKPWVFSVKYCPLYSVTFVNERGTAPAPLSVFEGDKIPAQLDPKAEGYSFVGWFEDLASGDPWVFETDVVTKDTVLYAKWEKKAHPIVLLNTSKVGLGTVTIENESTPVVSGGSVTGLVTNVRTGYRAYAFVDGKRVEIDADGKFFGKVNDSAKIIVTYAKDTAWFVQPFVKNTALMYNPYHPNNEGDVALSANEKNLFVSPDFNNYSGCEGTANGLWLYDVNTLSGYVGAYLGQPVKKQLGSNKGGYCSSVYEGFMSIIPLTSFTVVGVQQGSVGGNGNSVVYPLEGDWGGQSEALTETGAIPGDRYLIDSTYSDVNNGTVGTYGTIGLQWLVSGIESSDGNYVYVGLHARGEITKAAIGTDAAGHLTLKKTGVFWRTTTASGTGSGTQAVALTLYNNGSKDVVYAALASKRLVKLDEDQFSGEEYVNAYAEQKGEPAIVKDRKMIDQADISAYGDPRAMKIIGVAEGTPRMVVQMKQGKTLVFALGSDGNFASADPIVVIDGKNDLGLTDNLIGMTALDDETIMFANYEGKNASKGDTGCHLAMVTARPEKVTVRGTFGTYEEGVNTMVNYGANANVSFTAPAGKKIVGIKVNGVADANFTDAAYTFTDAALTQNVYIEMTVEDLPVAQIGTTTYKTLAAAFAAAKAGDTVELLRDATVADPITVADFKGTFDLSGFSVGTTFTADAYITFNGACDVVITNGTMATGTEIDIAGAAVVTVAANTTLNNAGNYGVYIYGTATLNIYGTINNTTGEMPCVWMGGSSTVNAYEGCVVNSTGDAFRVNGSGRTLNIYGGTFHGGYPIAYVYNSPNTSAINVYGGTFDSGNGFVGGGAKETAVVAPLTDACKAKFSQLGSNTWFLGLDHYCASGYEPVKGEDGYYTIQKASVEPADPEEPISSEDPEEDAKKMNNADGSVKPEFIKVPEGVTMDGTAKAAYAKLFKAVPGAGVVTIELNEAGTNAVEAAEQAAGTAALDAVLGTEGDTAALSVAAEDVIPGFFYSLKQSAAIESLGFKVDGDKNKLGGRDTISFTLDKAEASGFYQMIVSPTPVK